ncbi:MAG: hypothetical protein IJG83_07300 [Thermoguttaceae bacterium]|nr:hypothetical protein [Thermoguttaceae bacterium]
MNRQIARIDQRRHNLIVRAHGFGSAAPRAKALFPPRVILKFRGSEVEFLFSMV